MINKVDRIICEYLNPDGVYRDYRVPQLISILLYCSRPRIVQSCMDTLARTCYSDYVGLHEIGLIEYTEDYSSNYMTRRTIATTDLGKSVRRKLMKTWSLVDDR